MMISHGALLEDVYGTNDISIKKKKKEKKTRNNNIVHFLPEMEKDIEKEKQKHVFPEQLEKIDEFDTSFHRNTNIMPFGEGNFFNLDGTKDLFGRYSPAEVPPVQPPQGNNNERNIQTNENQVPPTTMRNVEVKQQPPPKQHLPQQPPPWDKGVNISQDDYDAFQEFIKFKAQQKIAMMNEQETLSQNNSEGFANVNDDFNDVLLFGLLGIFFLIFTDYISKLGRKSY